MLSFVVFAVLFLFVASVSCLPVFLVRPCFSCLLCVSFVFTCCFVCCRVFAVVRYDYVLFVCVLLRLLLLCLCVVVHCYCVCWL